MTDEEANALILQILEASDEPLEEAEIDAVMRWVHEARTDRHLLALFEAGKVSLRWKDGELWVKARL